MSELNDNYKKIITQIEEKITNKDDLDFVLKKVEELTDMFLGFMDKMATTNEERMERLEQKQKIIEQKVSSVAKAIDEIENDIYEEDDDETIIDERLEDSFEFEIICPYCSSKFIEQADENDEELKKETACPRCHNIIELDWENDDKTIDEDDDL